MARTDRTDFLREIIDDDLAAGRHTRVVTRFPPEPNGYLHIGHAKSICLNFGLARDYQGTCNLRYDDTNPTREDIEYVESIEHDVRWLGFAPSAVLFSADYFPRMYELAERLVRDGLAYVCDLDEEQIRAYRGTLSEPGRPSPFRDRTVDENLDLLRRMKAGEFPDGARVLRAKIDMAAANMKLRDPLLYRIRHAHHHRTGDTWCIYPMYDYAHPLEDALEGITHSICTLEFENNRALYDWVLDHTGPWTPRPRQYEFARLALDYTVMSKRKLRTLVEDKHVSGWDDPLMPTIAGMRRRGYSPEALRAFADLIGVAKANSTVDIGKLDHCLREDLNQHAPRVFGVLRPLAVELVNWDELVATASSGLTKIDAPYFPPDVGKPGHRDVSLSGQLFIEADDFREEPPPGFKRLAPGRTVRLRYGYCITCEEVVRDASGQPTRLRCRVLVETKGGKKPADGREVGGVIHWVDAATAVPAEVRLYDRLFLSDKPEEGGADFLTNLNPDRLTVVHGARVEASLAAAAPGSRWQFERTGYFVIDSVDSAPGALVFNRIIDLGGGPSKAAVVDAHALAAAGVVGAAVDPHDAVTVKGGAVPHGDPVPDARKINPKAKTRPKGKSPQEYRAEARVRDPELARAYDAMQAQHGLSANHADLLAESHASIHLFEGAVAAGADASAVAKWMINELPRALGERELADVGLRPAEFAALVTRTERGQLPAPLAKELLPEIFGDGATVAELVHSRGLDAQVSSAQLDGWVDAVITANADKVAQYRGGKTGLLGFFVGQVTKASGGRANPAQVSAALLQRLQG